MLAWAAGVRVVLKHVEKCQSVEYMRRQIVVVGSRA